MPCLSRGGTVKLTDVCKCRRRGRYFRTEDLTSLCCVSFSPTNFNCVPDEASQKQSARPLHVLAAPPYERSTRGAVQDSADTMHP